MIHAIIVAAFVLLLGAIAAWQYALWRFGRLLRAREPATARRLQPGGWRLFGGGKLIEYCLHRRYRELADAELRAAGERLRRSHQILTPLIASLICLIAVLIVFSSDPGDVDDTLWVY